MANVYSVSLINGSIVGSDIESEDLVAGYVYVVRNIDITVQSDSAANYTAGVYLNDLPVAQISVPYSSYDELHLSLRCVVPGPSVITVTGDGGPDGSCQFFVSGYQLVLP